MAGVTASSDFQVPGKVTPVFQSTNQAESFSGAPATAGFVTELDPSAGALLNQVRYSTYFGGGGIKILAPPFHSGSVGVGDAVTDLQVGDNIFVTGATASGSGGGTFPVSGTACQTTNNTSGILFGGLVHIPITAFASELNPLVKSGSAAQLVFSTLLGGTGLTDAGTGLAIDSFGDMVISGLTYSGDFPITGNAFQSSNGATGKSATNAFLTVIDPLGTSCALTGGTPAPTPSGSPSPSATPTPGGSISISANPVVFPNAGLGGLPKHKAFLIQNLSTKRALVGNVGVPGGGSPPFSTVSGGGAFNIPPVGMITVKMLFTPKALGPAADSLLVTSNDKLHPSVTVNLKGKGVPGIPSLSVPALAFGAVGIGILPGPTLTLKIHNIGLGALGGNVGALAAPFAVTSGGGLFGPIPPGGAQTVKVQFTPTAVGLASTTLVITTSDPAMATLHVPVSGSGAPGRLATNIPVPPVPPFFKSLNVTLGFGHVPHGTMKSKSFKIKNIGKGDLQGNVPSLSAPFSVTAGGGAFNLLPGATQAVTVQFAPPTALGHVSQSLVITVTPPGRPAAGITVTVSGRGT